MERSKKYMIIIVVVYSAKDTKMLDLNLLLGISFKSTEPFHENGVYAMR